MILLRNTRLLIRASVLASVLLFVHAPDASADPDVSKAQVQQAIDRAVRYIKSRQRDGKWYYRGTSRSYIQGVTSLSVYALLLAGTSPDDPTVVRGIKEILKMPYNETYSVGLVALALSEADPVKYRDQLKKVASWLINAQLGSGMFTYRSVGGGRGRGWQGDNSNTQFGVLGLWACARAGIDIPQAAWKRVQDHFRKSQATNGSWGYRPRDRGGRLSMALAGVGSLLIANGQLRVPGPT